MILEAGSTSAPDPEPSQSDPGQHPMAEDGASIGSGVAPVPSVKAINGVANFDICSVACYVCSGSCRGKWLAPNLSWVEEAVHIVLEEECHD